MRYELAELAVYELAVQKSEVPRKARVITRTIFSLITLLLANSEESGYLMHAAELSLPVNDLMFLYKPHSV